MLAGIRGRLTFANVMSTIAVFAALSGGAYAAVALPKNSVGAKQIKKNAVTSAKIGKNAVTSAKVKDGSLTGLDLNLATLPKVGSAANADNAGHATNADNATKATNADSATKATNADHATLADNIAAPEDWHEIGASGQPGFQGGTTNYGALGPNTNGESAGFFKDKEGIVHLKGFVKTAPSATPNAGLLFYLPEGYRPGAKKLLLINALCTGYSGGGGTCSPAGLQQMLIIGAGTDLGGGTINTDGLLVASSGVAISLEGLTFRAAG